MENWKKYHEKRKLQKKLNKKLSLLGSRVKTFKNNKEGILKLKITKNKDVYFYIDYGNNIDLLFGIPLKIYDTENEKFIDFSADEVYKYFALSQEEKNILISWDKNL